MFYIVSIKNRDLKAITVTEDIKIANSFLNRQEDIKEGIERTLFTNKKDCAKALYLHCNNFSCKDINSCLFLINLEVDRYKRRK